MHRWLVVLEGNNLSMKLVIEPPQCLLLMDGALTVKNLHASDHDLIGFVVPSHSCQRASEKVDFLAVVVVGHR